MGCGRWQQAIGRAAVPSPSSETGPFGRACLFVFAFVPERRSFGFAHAVVRFAPWPIYLVTARRGLRRSSSCGCRSPYSASPRSRTSARARSRDRPPGAAAETVFAMRTCHPTATPARVAWHWPAWHGTDPARATALRRRPGRCAALRRAAHVRGLSDSRRAGTSSWRRRAAETTRTVSGALRPQQ